MGFFDNLDELRADAENLTRKQRAKYRSYEWQMAYAAHNRMPSNKGLFPNRRPVPIETAYAVYKRCGMVCEDCGERRSLELHHLTYDGPREELIFGYEKPHDLAALCRDCHFDRHMWHGTFYGDIDELEGKRAHYHQLIEGRD